MRIFRGAYKQADLDALEDHDFWILYEQAVWVLEQENKDNKK